MKEITNDFEKKLADVSRSGLYNTGIRIIQVNVGLKCNQQCVHCHVSASPNRSEVMEWETMERAIEAAGKTRCELVDITGGSPELNPHFRRLVETLRQKDFPVQVRTNLTVLLEPGLRWIPAFYREYSIRLVASLPCYLEENVRTQRGEGVYERSIEAIKILNGLGYGIDSDLPLNLVYNPVGPVLPPNQSSLEQDYRRELGTRFGVEFSNLLTITNMPIGRFLTELRRQDKEKEYMDLLIKSFNALTVDGLMCRHQLSVDWDGRLFDCDFNLALGVCVNHGAPMHIKDFNVKALEKRRIVTGAHCFGCTAGSGSSCQGALAD